MLVPRRAWKPGIAADVAGDQEGAGLGVGQLPLDRLGALREAEAALVLGSSRAIAEPATSRDLRASSGPMPNRIDVEHAGHARPLARRVIAIDTGPA